MSEAAGTRRTSQRRNPGLASQLQPSRRRTLVRAALAALLGALALAGPAAARTPVDPGTLPRRPLTSSTPSATRAPAAPCAPCTSATTRLPMSQAASCATAPSSSFRRSAPLSASATTTRVGPLSSVISANGCRARTRIPSRVRVSLGAARHDPPQPLGARRPRDRHDQDNGPHDSRRQPGRGPSCSTPARSSRTLRPAPDPASGPHPFRDYFVNGDPRPCSPSATPSTTGRRPNRPDPPPRRACAPPGPASTRSRCRRAFGQRRGRQGPHSGLKDRPRRGLD